MDYTRVVNKKMFNRSEVHWPLHNGLGEQMKVVVQINRQIGVEAIGRHVIRWILKDAAQQNFCGRTRGIGRRFGSGVGNGFEEAEKLGV